MSRILLEDTSDFVVDKQSITEAVATGVKFPVIIKGRVSVCDEVNGNGRIYPKAVWERQLKAGSKLTGLFEKNRSLGLLEHPKDGNVSLLSPICSMTRKAWIHEAKSEGKQPVYEVWGEIAILGTPEGRKLWALVEGGYNPLVSSRGYGSISKGPTGHDQVCEDFECEGWDVVYFPSFAKAELDGKSAREAVCGVKAASLPWESMDQKQRFECLNKAVNDGLITAPNGVSVAMSGENIMLSAVPSLVETVTTQSSKPAALPVVTESVFPQPTKTNMEKLKPIQEAIRSLQSVNASGLEPVRLAEHLAKVDELHREVAAVTAGDNKLSWDGTRLHEELNQFASRLNEAAKAPAAHAKKLEEREVKTLKTLQAITELGAKFRTKFSEAKKLAESTKSDLAESIRRGRGWMERCKLAESKLKKLDEQYTLATDGLDLMTERYHADTSDLARRLMVLEMSITDEATLNRLNEAKSVKALTAIKEELAAKIEEAKKAAPKKDDEKKVAKSDCDDKKTEEKKPKVNESMLQPAPRSNAAPTPVVTATTVRPFTINESVDMSRRLAAARK